MISEHSAGFVVFRQNGKEREYLVLHYPGGHYDFAKGHLEAGETAKEAAVRELSEETGITKIKMIEGFENNIFYRFRRKSEIVSKTVTFYLCEAFEEEVKISHEHKGFLWLKYEQAEQKVTFDNAKLLLHKAEKYLTKTQYAD